MLPGLASAEDHSALLPYLTRNQDLAAPQINAGRVRASWQASQELSGWRPAPASWSSVVDLLRVSVAGDLITWNIGRYLVLRRDDIGGLLGCCSTVASDRFQVISSV